MEPMIVKKEPTSVSIGRIYSTFNIRQIKVCVKGPSQSGACILITITHNSGFFK